MSSHRQKRLSEDVKRELTDIIRTLKDPRVRKSMLSVVRVELAADLSYAKVYVSSIDGMEEAKNAVKGLESAAGFIRREINTRLKLRRSPQFQFVADNSIEHSAHLSKILGGLNEK